MSEKNKTKKKNLDSPEQLRERISQLEGIIENYRTDWENLEKSEAQYRQIIEETVDTVFMTNIQGLFTYVNPSSERQTGYSRAELLGMHFTVLIDNEWEEEVLSFYLKQLKEKKNETILEFPIITKSGERKWVEQVVILISGKDRIEGFQGIVRDITKRKNTELALMESRERYDALFKRSNDGVYVYDLHGNFIDANETALSMLGYSRKDIKNINFATLISEEHKRAAFERLTKLIKTGILEDEAELWLRRKDGSELCVEAKGVLLYKNGEPYGVQGIVRDITERKKKQQELLWIKDSAIATSINAIALYDLEGKITYVNRSFLNMWGYENETEVKGQHFKDFWTSKEESSNIFSYLLDNGQWIGESTARRKDNSEFYAQISATIVTNPNNMPLCIMSSFLDISKRKSIEEAMRKREEKYRSIVDSLSELLFTVDDTGAILFVNALIENLTGYTREEIIGNNFSDYIYPEDRSVLSIALEKMENRIEFEERTGSDIEFRLQKKNNDLIWIEVRARPIYDLNDVFIGFNGIAIDITERKKTGEMLLASERRYHDLYEQSNQREHLYESLLNSMPDAVVIYNLEGKAIYINPAFTETFGFTTEDVAGKSVPYVPEDEVEKSSIITRRVLRNEPVSGFECKRITKDGKIRDVTLSSSCYHDHDGKPAGFLVILRDITENKYIERQLRQAQKMEAVGTLAGGIAHDFNNLLQAVQGYTQLLLMNLKEGEQSYYELKEIENAVQRAAGLTHQLLTFSRKLESNLRPVDMNDAVRETKRLLLRTIPKMIEINVELSEEKPMVKADPSQIEQVLINLVVNARDAMPEGGNILIKTEKVSLDDEYCKTHPGTVPGEYALLIVKDTGHGMDKETSDHIFDPFFTTKGMGKGSGLGLSIVYGIVKNHGGYIICTSEPGKGATFKIYLTLMEDASGFENIEDDELPRGGNETIMLVDDESSIRDFGKKILEKFGYKVITASDGEKALQKFIDKNNVIDLVILDLLMPGMGGKRCLEEMLKNSPSAKVVITSGFFLKGTKKEAIEAGARGFISKPYEIKEMLRIVREILDKK